jgi:tRNA (guanine10-N2)-methyltransferase
MKNPDVRFWIIDSIGGFDPLGLPPLQDRIVFFGREIGCSERSALGKYDLKKRRYIGPTSMDAEISFLMANQVGYYCTFYGFKFLINEASIV